jgi:hypothetical protein
MRALAAVVAAVVLGCAASFSDNGFYYKHWCGSGLQYLDDAKCAKVFPR